MIYLQFKLNTCCLTLVSNVNLLLVVLLWSRWSKIWLQIRLLEGAITRNLLKSIRRKKIFRCVKHTFALQTQSTTVWEKKEIFWMYGSQFFLKMFLRQCIWPLHRFIHKCQHSQIQMSDKSREKHWLWFGSTCPLGVLLIIFTPPNSQTTRVINWCKSHAMTSRDV